MQILINKTSRTVKLSKSELNALETVEMVTSGIGSHHADEKVASLGKTVSIAVKALIDSLGEPDAKASG